MKLSSIFVALSALAITSNCFTLQLSSAAISAFVISFSFVYKDTLLCFYSECCSQKWVNFNKTEFSAALASRVYGQPLAQRLATALHGHWSVRQPDKALAVALHGPTGTGKNYAVRIMAEHLFRRGTRSRFFHFFSAVVHFPHGRLQTRYSEQLSEWIRGNVSACPRSVFVFDEVDKMPVPVLDTLHPFLDYNERVDGVDFRRAVFIFLSNSGSDLIMSRMVQLRLLGLKRGADFGRLLAAQVDSDNDSALHNSSLVRDHLVSSFIPFLPLERHHVIGCVEDYLRTNHPHLVGRSDLIERVLEQLQFVPAREKLFASAGCKRIMDKTLMVLQNANL